MINNGLLCALCGACSALAPLAARAAPATNHATMTVPGLQQPAQIRLDRWGGAHLREDRQRRVLRTGLQCGARPLVSAGFASTQGSGSPVGCVWARVCGTGSRRAVVSVSRRHDTGMEQLRARGPTRCRSFRGGHQRVYRLAGPSPAGTALRIRQAGISPRTLGAVRYLRSNSFAQFKTALAHWGGGVGQSGVCRR